MNASRWSLLLSGISLLISLLAIGICTGAFGEGAAAVWLKADRWDSGGRVQVVRLPNGKGYTMGGSLDESLKAWRAANGEAK